MGMSGKQKETFGSGVGRSVKKEKEVLFEGDTSRVIPYAWTGEHEELGVTMTGTVTAYDEEHARVLVKETILRQIDLAVEIMGDKKDPDFGERIAVTFDDVFKLTVVEVVDCRVTAVSVSVTRPEPEETIALDEGIPDGLHPSYCDPKKLQMRPFDDYDRSTLPEYVKEGAAWGPQICRWKKANERVEVVITESWMGTGVSVTFLGRRHSRPDINMTCETHCAQLVLATWPSDLGGVITYLEKLGFTHKE
jgi:hypothetical protein